MVKRDTPNGVTPWWRTVAAVIAYERRIALRTWRFWLLFGLMAFVVYLAWSDYYQMVEDDLYMDAALAFLHQGVGIAVLVLCVGSVLLGIDSSARLDRTRVSALLYTRPMGTVAFLVGRYISVVVVLIPLSAIGWFFFPVILQTIDRTDVVWQPFGWVYLTCLLPMMLMGVAVGLCMRIIFRRDFTAISASFVFLICFFVLLDLVGFQNDLMPIVATSLDAGMRQSPNPDESHAMLMYRIQSSVAGIGLLPSPGLGLPFDWMVAFRFITVTLLATLSCILIAPLYLRRQDPQYTILSHSPRWYSAPTIRRAIVNLRFDKQLTWLPKLFGIAALLGVAGFVGYGINEAIAQKREAQQSLSEEKTLETFELRKNHVDILAYDIETELDPFHNRLAVNGTLRFRADGGEVDRLNLTLPPYFQLESMTVQDASATIEPPMVNVRILHIDPPVADGGEAAIHFAYRGHLPMTIFAKAGQLAKGENWYPQLYEPPRNSLWPESNTFHNRQTDVFDARVRVKGVVGSVILAGQDIQETNREDWVELKTLFPIDDIALFWGPFSAIDDRFGPTPIKFLMLSAHEYQSQVYIREMRDRQESILGKLGAPHLPRLVFMERPSWLQRFSHPELSGVIEIPEQKLVYLHEGIWDLDRYDIDPKQVDYFQFLPLVVDELRRDFLNRFISTYFRGTYEPVGPLGFWIGRYLPSYIMKVLEPNPWTRMWSLQFDAGDTIAPVLVKRSLLEMETSPKDSYRHWEAERIRGEGLWRTLHHALGDATWWRFVRQLLARHYLQTVSQEDVQAVAEEVAGKSLQNFFSEWVLGDALPSYEIALAEAELTQDPDSFLAKYRCKVKVRNHGTGSIDVPIFIKTELDELQRLVWIESGGEGILEVEVPHRPVFVKIDPSHWLVQENFHEPGKRGGDHHERRFEIIQRDSAILILPSEPS